MHINTYILAAHRLISEPELISIHKEHHQEVLEDGLTVFYQNEAYQFAHHHLSCEREMDDIESDLLCPECWITYTLRNEAGELLGKKSFISHCQERFWLNRQYHELVQED